MDFRAFERLAHEIFDEIPDEYRDGVDGLVVRRDSVPHPTLRDVYTLGECLTEDHLSDYGSSETTRSLIALYWGSFRQLAREDPDFDWEAEAWETVTHELRHHLESLARDDALEDVDYAADESFKRFAGQEFDPWYWQRGDEEGPGLYRVEKSWYLERAWTRGDLESSPVWAEGVLFVWCGVRYRVPRPVELGDVHFILVHGVEMEARDEELELVLVRRRRWWQSVRRLFGSPGTEVLESEADAEPIEREG